MNYYNQRPKPKQEENPFAHLFNKLEMCHKHFGDDLSFSALDVLAMLHLAMPKGLGWDVAYALSIKAGCSREEAEASLEKLRQTTMELGKKEKIVSTHSMPSAEELILMMDF